MGLNIKEIVSAFVVLFAVIDIIGSIPVIVNLRKRKGEIKAMRVCTASLITLIVFLLAGEGILNLFGVTISSFAVAGSIVLFVLAAEMIFDIHVFKDESPNGNSDIVPLVFPLIAGAGAFTTLLSLRAEYQLINILIAVLLNTMVVYFVLRSTEKIERLFGKESIYVLRKFFGIILMAIAVKLFTNNLDPLLSSLSLTKNLAYIRHFLETFSGTF